MSAIIVNDCPLCKASRKALAHQTEARNNLKLSLIKCRAHNKSLKRKLRALRAAQRSTE